MVEAVARRQPLVTGAVSGIIVLDVDPRNDGEQSLAALEAAHGPLPVTVESHTGGGGRHLFFCHPASPVPTGPLVAGLDLKGDGGLVVVPPSLHPSGARYRWAPGQGPDQRQPPAAPPWLLAGADPAMIDPARPPPSRTASEQADFAALWGTLGVQLMPGDQMYRCPLHDDHHPSLHIDAEGCRWLCFGCRRGGGVGRLRRIVHGQDPHTDTVPIVPVTLAGGDTVDVVGEARHQDALLALTGGRRRYGGASLDTIAHLVPEPGNPTDPAAIAVFIGRHVVGHLRRCDAHRYRAVVDEAIRRFGAASCAATIRGGWEHRGDVGRFGVTLWLTDRPTIGNSARPAN